MPSRKASFVILSEAKNPSTPVTDVAVIAQYISKQKSFKRSLEAFLFIRPSICGRASGIAPPRQCAQNQ